MWSSNNNQFGEKQYCEINVEDKHISDPNAFLFSFKSNGRMKEMVKFPIKNPNEAFMLYDSNNSWLISIGCGEEGGKDDITIMKKDCQYFFGGMLDFLFLLSYNMK